MRATFLSFAGRRKKKLRNFIKRHSLKFCYLLKVYNTRLSSISITIFKKACETVPLINTTVIFLTLLGRRKEAGSPGGGCSPLFPQPRMSSGKENPEVLDIPEVKLDILEVKVPPETETGTVILQKANLDS